MIEENLILKRNFKNNKKIFGVEKQKKINLIKNKRKN